MQVLIGQPLIGALSAQTKVANRPVEALIDTGAGRSVINPVLAVSLGLRQVDSIKVARVGGIDEAPVYAASMTFPGTSINPVLATEITAISLPSQPVSCLIGRDVLQRWVMMYDGRTGIVTIDDPPSHP